METNSFDPITDISGSELILDDGAWPNFHDAEIHRVLFWRGDIRPDDNVWIGPVVELSLELTAIEKPIIVDLKFSDCDQVKLGSLGHQNALHDLLFTYEARGFNPAGEALPPFIKVTFEQFTDLQFSLRCFSIEVIAVHTVISNTGG